MKSEQYLFLKRKYKTICKARRNSIYVCSEWDTLELFIESNKKRFLKAWNKWINYKSVITGEKLIGTPIWFARKNNNEGYTFENTLFSSPSDCKKYSKSNHLILLNGRELGTRDIKNILKKRKINLNVDTIGERVKSGKDLFEKNGKKIYLYKGNYVSLSSIAKEEGIRPGFLQRKMLQTDLSIEQCIDYCKINIKGYKAIFYNGKYMTKQDIATELSELYNFSFSMIYSRLKTHGLYLPLIVSPIKIPSIYPIYNVVKIRVESNEINMIFESITKAAKYLNADISVISKALKKGKYKTFKLYRLS